MDFDLERVVQTARSDFLHDQVPYVELHPLLANRHPGLEVSPYMLLVRDKFPKASCYLAAEYLLYLTGEGEVVYGGYETPTKIRAHAYLRIGETIADITADQFGGPETYVGPLVRPWLPEFVGHDAQTV